MATNGPRAKDQGKVTVSKIVVTAIACVVALVLIVILLQIVIRNGASLIREAGERPIETPVAEDVWVPEINSSDGIDGEQIVPPTYAPNVADNADFQNAVDENAIEVIDTPENLAKETIPPEGNLFEPEDFDEE